MDDNLFFYGIEAVDIVSHVVKLSDPQKRLCAGASISYLGEIRGQRIHDKLAENIVAILQDKRCQKYGYVYGKTTIDDYYRAVSNITDQLLETYELNICVPKKQRSKFVIEAAYEIYVREMIINNDEGIFLDSEPVPTEFWKLFKNSSLIKYLSMIKERNLA